MPYEKLLISQIALEPSQWDKFMMSQWHNPKAIAITNAHPQANHTFLLLASNRFALLSEVPTEKPERCLAVKDLWKMKITIPLGAPAALVKYIMGAKGPKTSSNFRSLCMNRFSKSTIYSFHSELSAVFYSNMPWTFPNVA